MRGNPGAGTLTGPGFGKIGNHQAAFIGATAAGFGAKPAMFQRMLCAFFGAHFTNLGANSPDRVDHFAVARHVRRRQAANLRAVHIQLDATRHLFHIFFREAGHGALIAGIGAIIARLDAGSELFMNHKASWRIVTDHLWRLSCGTDVRRFKFRRTIFTYRHPAGNRALILTPNPKSLYLYAGEWGLDVAEAVTFRIDRPLRLLTSRCRFGYS